MTVPPAKPDAIILLVEDDRRNSELTRVMLKIAGYNNMIYAESGKDVARVVEPYAHIDLVLCDIQMPGEDGYQLYERLRRMPQLQNTPIIAVTALVMPDDVTRVEEAGFNGFMGKPFNFDRFGGQIGRILAGESVWEAR